MSVVKALRAAILVLAVLIGQAHACAPYFVASDGQKCLACVDLPCGFDTLDACKAPSIGARDSVPDCHACCSLKSCDDGPSHGDKAATQSPMPEMLLPELPRLPVVYFELQLPRISIQAANQYANPPPGTSSSRAPPLQLS